jgi:hypothetical protein
MWRGGRDGARALCFVGVGVVCVCVCNVGKWPVLRIAELCSSSYRNGTMLSGFSSSPPLRLLRPRPTTTTSPTIGFTRAATQQRGGSAAIRGQQDAGHGG